MGNVVGRYYDPTTGAFLTVDPLQDVTGAPYAYVAGDPVNGNDPYGLGPFGIDLNPADAVSGAYHSAVNLGNAALPYIHDASGYVATVASFCAVVTSETIVGGVTCGAIALGAGGVDAGTGAILYSQHRESGATLALDLAGLAASGSANFLEAAAGTARGLNAADRAIGQIRMLRAGVAPLYAKPGLWLSSQWLLLKSSFWEAVANGLAAEARGASGTAFGLGVYGAAAGNGPVGAAGASARNECT